MYSSEHAEATILHEKMNKEESSLFDNLYVKSTLNSELFVRAIRVHPSQRGHQNVQ
jgi:hypothetical protein